MTTGAGSILVPTLPETADAISFDPDVELLRIHDSRPTRSDQVRTASRSIALFRLEYNVVPTISMHLRIYQERRSPTA